MAFIKFTELTPLPGSIPANALFAIALPTSDVSVSVDYAFLASELAGLFFVDEQYNPGFNWTSNEYGVTQAALALSLNAKANSIHATFHEFGGGDAINVAGLSGELADPQPPKTHGTTHQFGESDPFNVGGLSGELADPQPPKAHKASHITGGADEIDGATETTSGLVNTLAQTWAGIKTFTATPVGPSTAPTTDYQLANKKYVDDATAAAIILQGEWDADTNTPDITGTTTSGYAWRVTVAGSTNLGGITDWDIGDLAVKTASGWLKIDNTDVSAVWGNITGILSNQTDLQSALDGKASTTHAATHANGGPDEINVAGLSGELADPQPPKTHATTHQDGGPDEINVAGLSGELADPQPPKTHAATHSPGGGDAIALATESLAGIIEIATQAEVDAQTDDERAVTPLKLKNGKFVRGPAVSADNEIPIFDGLTGDQLQQSSVYVQPAPTGGSGFQVVAYATTPTSPPVGFIWMQDKDANTKTLSFSDGTSIYSVDLSK
jgi:hypothetical protein